MNRSKLASLATLVAALATAGALPGCKHKTTKQAAASASASAAVSAPHAIPIPADKISKAVNPKGAKPWSGPTGTIAGTVTVTGDAPPTMSKVLKIIPSKCGKAPDMYGKLFRVDDQHRVANVLVTVTGYNAFVPARSDKKIVVGRGCAWNTRTVALTFGQKLEVRSRGRTAYVPELKGGNMASQMVAIPGGSDVTLYPNNVGRYQLLDSMHLFMKANVLVLKYSTFAVTGPDGHFEIKGVPVQDGKVVVTAFLPQAMVLAEHRVKVEPGKTTQVDLQLKYKKPAAEPEASSKPAPAKVPVIR